LEAWIAKVFKLAGLNPHGIPTADSARKRKAA
jgi:hypothetical protein